MKLLFKKRKNASLLLFQSKIDDSLNDNDNKNPRWFSRALKFFRKLLKKWAFLTIKISILDGISIFILLKFNKQLRNFAFSIVNIIKYKLNNVDSSLKK